MTRDEIIEKIKETIRTANITSDGYDASFLGNRGLGLLVDFILANFVPKSEKIGEGTIWYLSELSIVTNKTSVKYGFDGLSKDIARENQGKQAILIIKDEE